MEKNFTFFMFSILFGGKCHLEIKSTDDLMVLDYEISSVSLSELFRGLTMLQSIFSDSEYSVKVEMYTNSMCRIWLGTRAKVVEVQGGDDKLTLCK